MKVRQNDDRRLLIVDFPWAIGLVVLFGGTVSLGRLIYLLIHEVWTGGDLIGMTLGALLWFGGGLAFAQRSVFDFDLQKRELRWRRQGFPKRRGGTVAFDDIQSVNVDVEPSESSLSYRVALQTTGGKIPLTTSYDVGEERLCEEIRGIICRALAMNTVAQMEHDILELAAAGRKIEAIALTEKRYRMDLTKATAFVEDLTNG